MMYPCRVFDSVVRCVEELFTYNEAGYSFRSSTDSKIQSPKSKLKIYKKSFHFSGPEIWNSIPIHIRNSKFLKSFQDNFFFVSTVIKLSFHYSVNAECYDDYCVYIHIYIYVCVCVLRCWLLYRYFVQYVYICLYPLKASEDCSL